MSTADFAAGLRGAFKGGSRIFDDIPSPTRTTTAKTNDSDRKSPKAFVWSQYGIQSAEPDATTNYIPEKRQADEAMHMGRYEIASALYIKAAHSILGPNVTIPVRGAMRCDEYVRLSPWEQVGIMEFYNKIGRCMVELKRLEAALAWLEEINVIYDNSQFAAGPKFDWFDVHVGVFGLFSERFNALALLSNIYLELGNTGVALQRRWRGYTLALGDLPRSVDPAALHKIITKQMVDEVTHLRHPDPELVAKLNLQDDDLQIRGSWQKIAMRKSRMPPTRTGFASFVWRGHLYVAGGEKAVKGPYYRDLWRLDLQKLDTWQALPPHPPLKFASEKFYGWSMAVHEDRAYLFNNFFSIDYFDLVKQEWGSTSTTWGGPGVPPHIPDQLVDYTMQLVNGRLYVFGGMHAAARIGCNLLMELHLNTMKWRRLSGTSEPKVDSSCPGPRRCATSWVSKDTDKIYVMYGESDRLGASLNGQPQGAPSSHTCDDMWSWSIREEKWTKERITGNLPCARSEMSTTYNECLDKIIVFGGYSPTLPTFLPVNGDAHGYSYFADTFIYDPLTSPPKWKQVITRGFPTYRAHAKIFSDPDTGKIYLFGGYTNSHYVPSRSQSSSQNFGDLWQLRLDIKGGFFEGVDLEEETRTAKAGPWQRCFSCGSAGPWKKCGGSCKGRAFFCDNQCLKDGWKEHKAWHKCYKEA